MSNQLRRVPNKTEHSLLLVNDHLYVKETNRPYHACFAKDEQGEKCTILFPDGSAGRISEHGIIWLGFQDFPRSQWPIGLIAGKPSVKVVDRIASLKERKNNFTPRMRKIRRSGEDLMRLTKLGNAQCQNQGRIEECSGEQWGVESFSESGVQPRSV